MTDYTYCQNCKIVIPYIKDKDRYVTCLKCKQDLYVGTKNCIKRVSLNAPKLLKK